MEVFFYDDDNGIINWIDVLFVIDFVFFWIMLVFEIMVMIIIIVILIGGYDLIG